MYLSMNKVRGNSLRGYGFFERHIGNKNKLPLKRRKSTIIRPINLRIAKLPPVGLWYQSVIQTIIDSKKLPTK
jgi:hypothetical protein